MKTKKIIIGLVVVACAGAAVGGFLWWRQAPQDSADAAEDATPTVVSVRVGSLKRITLHRYITAYGTVEPAPATASGPAASASLAATVAGVVARVDIVEGQPVKKGDALMELDSAGVTLKYAEEEVARQEKLYAGQNTSLRNLQSAENQLAMLRVLSPLAGMVTRVNVTPGAAVDPTTAVAEVVDLTRLTLRAEIPESDAGELKPGEEVQTLTPRPVDGNLFFVSPTVNTNNGAVLARAQLAADSGLRPGQFVQLRVVTGTHTNCLAAPAASVVTDITGQSVIALVNGDKATQTPVKTGYREDDWVEVEGPGLKAGDSVVTTGAYGLPDQTKIKSANTSEDADAQTNSPRLK